MISLRSYQQDLIDSLDCETANGHRRVLLQAPTGAGKTVIAMHLASRDDRTVMFLCHRRELAEQTSNTFAENGIDHGMIMAGEKIKDRPVQIAMVQTLARRKKKPPAQLLIFDEAHHIAAGTWAKISEEYSDASHVGLSATPIRLDRTGLRDHFDALVRGPEVMWLQEQGYLATCDIYGFPAPDMKKVRKRGGEFSPKHTACLMGQVIGDAIGNWKKYSNERSSILFAPSVESSQYFASMFSREGIPAAHLDGSTPKAMRREIIERFADREYLVLCNVGLFGEGFDLSALIGRRVTIDCLIDMAPTVSLSSYLQRHGRILRPKADGRPAVALDHAGNSDRHGWPNAIRPWTLDGVEKIEKPPKTCPSCFRQYLAESSPSHCVYCGASLIPPKPESDIVTQIDLMLGRDGIILEKLMAEHFDLDLRVKKYEECETYYDFVKLGKSKDWKKPAAKFHYARYLAKKLGMSKERAMKFVEHELKEEERACKDIEQLKAIAKIRGHHWKWAYHRAHDLGIAV